MAAWDQYEAQADTLIDQQFGEPAVITPYKVDGYSDPAVDGTRSVANVVGYVVSRANSPMGDLHLKRVQGDFLFSVQNKYLDDVRKGDRVTLTQRNNREYEIGWIEPKASARSILHLLLVTS